MVFDAVPPAQFTYWVRLKDAAGTTVKTVTATVPTGGQASVPVVVYSPAVTDNPQPLPIGGYKSEFEVQASGYPTYLEPFCHGVTSCGQCSRCPPETPSQGGPS